ncbi:MAG: thiolase family protein [Saprospiraceae bacterium]|nr:thiolase family protein [Saprospiraceae bacterium]
MNNNPVYIIEAFRSPFAKLYGGLMHWRADDMLTTLIQKVIRQSSKIEASKIEQLFVGCANQAGEDNRNIARQAILLSGLPTHITGMTLNSLCTSGMDAIQVAANAIQLGQCNLCLAAAVDNMSRSPWVEDRNTGQREDSTIGWRFINPKLTVHYQPHAMPETAELLAAKLKISRQQQDEYSIRSREAYEQAWQRGVYAKELLHLDDKLLRDEQHRLMDWATLAKLPAMTQKGNTVTLGNTSRIGDGVAVLALASEEYVQKHQVQPLVKILGGGSAAVHPDEMGLAPVAASEKLLKRLGMTIHQMQQIELSEAFAVQSLACMQAWKIPRALVNPNGGAISIGKPLSVSSARLVVSLANAMQENTDIQYGMAAACAGLGLGACMVLENIVI